MAFTSYQAFQEDTKVASSTSYVLRVFLAGFPKLAIIAFSVVIAGYMSEAAFTSSEPIVPSAIICYNNGVAFKSGHRICHNGLAAAITSILMCMMLLIFDTFIPCLNKLFKRLAHLFSLLFSIIMSVYMLVTSALLANLYTRYCDHIEPFSECGDDERNFLILPVFGFLTMIGWVVVGIFSTVLLVLGA